MKYKFELMNCFLCIPFSKEPVEEQAEEVEGVRMGKPEESEGK